MGEKCEHQLLENHGQSFHHSQDQIEIETENILWVSNEHHSIGFLHSLSISLHGGHFDFFCCNLSLCVLLKNCIDFDNEAK